MPLLYSWNIILMNFVVILCLTALEAGKTGILDSLAIKIHHYFINAHILMRCNYYHQTKMLRMHFNSSMNTLLSCNFITILCVCVYMWFMHVSAYILYSARWWWGKLWQIGNFKNLVGEILAKCNELSFSSSIKTPLVCHPCIIVYHMQH